MLKLNISQALGACGVAIFLPILAQAQTPPPPMNAPPTQSAYPPDGDYPAPPPEPPAPQGYDAAMPPPPPPGYQSGPDDGARQAWDNHYAANAEQWARDNCVRSHGDTATGAVVGGVLGALIGSGLQSRHDHGAGTLAGAALGAAGGAVVTRDAGGNATSPGCPPGYVVRRDAPPYSYYEPGYYYAAPGWYQPWIFAGGIWSYRPYPYHDWYYRTYRAYPVRFPMDRRWHRR